ncbi:hypothetical protein [Methylobacterium sp. yr668]|uniref:hypothetical protein n=1 Tax=Methylobacterium sp. yr668 TaxID=1761801 RepID=UPI0008F0CBA2|nr:hypothetical protein [Methylobacterium sp. yr668]SFS86938.1 hypothetical protein SAMN04487845_108257 [Methylobacterium sp. yr668]
MSDGHHPIRWHEADPIQKAVDALRARGHTVEPWTGGLPYWLVDGETLTDGDLLALAVRVNLMDSTSTKLH